MPKRYSDLYVSVRKSLRDAGIEAAAIEARLMIAGAAGKSSAELLRDMQYYVSEEFEKEVNSMLKRRLAGEPVAYITGSWEFYGLPIDVDRSVLIPRMDTEVLAKAVIDELMGKKMNARILDLCCGSGCIGIAIADSLPQSRIVMADSSKEALKMCRHNVEKNGFERIVSYLEADVMKPPPMMTGSFDVLVSNPPYIPNMDILTLDSSVRDYEPIWALSGGDDGLDFYRAILRDWVGIVRTGGSVMFEVGEGQADRVCDLMRMAALREVRTILDTRGRERVVVAKA